MAATDPTPQFLHVSTQELRDVTRVHYDAMSEFVDDQAAVSGDENHSEDESVVAADDDDDEQNWDEDEEVERDSRDLYRQVDNAASSPPPAPRKPSTKRRIMVVSSSEDSDDDATENGDFVYEKSENEEEEEDGRNDDDDDDPAEAAPAPVTGNKKPRKTEAEKQEAAKDKQNGMAHLRERSAPNDPATSAPIVLEPGQPVRITIVLRVGKSIKRYQLTGAVQSPPRGWYDTDEVLRAMASGNGIQDLLKKSMIVTIGLKLKPDDKQSVGNEMVRVCLPGAVIKRADELSNRLVFPFEHVIATATDDVPCFLWLAPDIVLKSNTGKVERAKLIKQMKAAVHDDDDDGSRWPETIVSTSAVFKNAQATDHTAIVDVLKALLNTEIGERIGIIRADTTKDVLRTPEVDEEYIKRVFTETPKAAKRAPAAAAKPKSADAKKPPPPPKQRQMDEFTKKPDVDAADAKKPVTPKPSRKRLHDDDDDEPVKKAKKPAPPPPPPLDEQPVEPKPSRKRPHDDPVAPPAAKKPKTADTAGAPKIRYNFTEFDAVNCRVTAVPIDGGSVGPLDVGKIYAALISRDIPVHSLVSDGKSWTLNAKAPPLYDAANGISHVAVPKFLQLLAELN